MDHFELEKKIQRLKSEIHKSNQDLMEISKEDALLLLKKISTLETTLESLLRSVYAVRHNA